MQAGCPGFILALPTPAPIISRVLDIKLIRDKPDFVLGTCICRGQLCFWERGDRDSCLYDFHRDTEDSMAAPHVALRSEPAHEIGLSLA